MGLYTTLAPRTILESSKRTDSLVKSLRVYSLLINEAITEHERHCQLRCIVLPCDEPTSLMPYTRAWLKIPGLLIDALFDSGGRIEVLFHVAHHLIPGMMSIY